MPSSNKEKFYLSIYESKERILLIFRTLTFFISVSLIGTLVYYHGFPISLSTKEELLAIVKVGFVFFIIKILVRYVLEYERSRFLKENWLEVLFMLLLLSDGITDLFFGFTLEKELFKSMGWLIADSYYALLIQVYFLIIVALEVSRTSFSIEKVKFNPAHVFILSFIVIVITGTFLLLLPEMTVGNEAMPFIDALFTSTSATCVTGLIVVDTATYFTFKGHFILMVLIKLGGLNIIAFGTIYALLSNFGIGLKQHSVLEDFINKDTMMSATGMLKKIIIWSFMIEFVGALLIYLSWGDAVPFTGEGNKIFSSLFHSFSAFNSAGFTLFTDGLYNEHLKSNYMIHVMVTILVFFGALGFIAIFNIFSFTKIRERVELPWKQIDFSTKIALYFSAGLVAIGALVFFFLESDNTMSDKNVVESIVTSIFQSTTRTSGFSTVNIQDVGMPMIIMFLFLMFVGASSSSTGGGLKTSTFAFLYASVIATIRGRKKAEIFNHAIPSELRNKAIAILMFFILGNLIGIFLLSITETAILAEDGRTLLDLIFEEVSAFGTVGLSMGITASLSVYGKVIIMISMLVGRLGTLTIAYAIGKSVISSDYHLPEGNIVVG
ncbi:MAG: ATPase [Bacteroidetes bacterium]|nr:MAG: ATPase [Bacteroidota bacterium]